MKTLLFHSIRLSALFSLLILSGCGGGDASSPGSSTGGGRPLYEIRMDLQNFAVEHNLDEDPEVAALQEKAFEAARDFNRFRREQPELQELYAKSDELRDAQVKARIDGDNEAASAAMSEYASVRSRLEAESAKLPAVMAKAEEMKALDEELLRALASAASEVNAEGEKLATELENALN